MEVVRRLTRTLAFVLFWFVLSPLVRAGVLEVGPAGSGAAFRQIQAAIDAAAPDDVILVQPGTYERIQVEQPLRIVGTASDVLIDGGTDASAVVVRNIAAGQEFVLSGICARSVGFFTRPTTIQLENSPGTLILQNLVVENDLLGPSYVALRCTSCARVLVLRSRIVHAGELDTQTGAIVTQASELWIDGTTVRGGDDASFALSGAHAVQATDSTLRVWRSVLVGGGAEGKRGIGDGQGGAAIRALRSRVELFGGPDGSLAGGNGEDPLFGEGFGGPGVDLVDHSSARIQDDIPITGGRDGSDLTQAPRVRADGTSSFTLDPRVHPTLESGSARAQVGSPLAFTLHGNAGGYQVLFLSLRTGPSTTFPGVAGLALLDRTNLFQLYSQVLPPAGTHTLTIQVPSQPALLGTTLILQSVERTGIDYAISNPVLVPISG